MGFVSSPVNSDDESESTSNVERQRRNSSMSGLNEDVALEIMEPFEESIIFEQANVTQMDYDYNRRVHVSALFGNYPVCPSRPRTPLGIDDEKKLACWFISFIPFEVFQVEWSNIMIGEALWNIFKTNQEDGFTLWSSKNQNNTHSKWDSIEPNPRGLPTIVQFVYKHNPNMYMSWKSDWISQAFGEVVRNEGNKLSIAILLARFAWPNIITINGLSKQGNYDFYAFDGYGLNREAVTKTTLYTLLITKVVRYLEKMHQFLSSYIYCDKKPIIEKIDYIIKKIIGNTEPTVIPKLAAGFLDRNDFLTYRYPIDRIRFNNCVLQTTKSGIYIRTGFVEDFLTKGTKMDYPFFMDDYYNMHGKYHPIIDDWNEWFRKTFGTEDSLDEFMKIDFASYARAGNKEKLFRTFLGMGNNSKSMMVLCLSIAYGELCNSIPTSLFSGKAVSSGGALSELAEAEGSFLVLLSEPDSSEYMFGGRIKLFTSGGDPMYVRNIYESGRKVVFKFKIIIQSNYNLQVVQGGKAFDARVFAVPFTSTFDNYAPDDEQEQYTNRHFKVDRDFSDNLFKMAQAYWWMTVHKYYLLYLKAGTGPDKNTVTRARTSRYIRQNNIVLYFFDYAITLKRNSDGTFDENYKTNVSKLQETLKRFSSAKSVRSHLVPDNDLFACDFHFEAIRQGIPFEYEDESRTPMKVLYKGIECKNFI